MQVNAGGNQLNLQYNGGNQRVLSDDGIQKRMYIHGTNDYPLLEKVKDIQGNEKIIQYIYGNSGLLAMKDGSGDWNFMLKDHLGSNRLVLNSSNAILGRYDFAAYGQLIGNTYESATDDNYRFTGQEYDQATGLYNYRARLYDPDLGRFYAMDPAGQFASPYVGIGNNPVMMTDPNGEFGFLAGLLTSTLFKTVVSGAVFGGLQNGIYATQNGGDFGDAFLKGALTGGLSAGLGYYAPPGIIPGTLWGAGSGALMSLIVDNGSTGTLISGMSSGALSGGIFGGLKAAASSYERNVYWGNLTDKGRNDMLSDWKMMI